LVDLFELDVTLLRSCSVRKNYLDEGRNTFHRNIVAVLPDYMA